MLSTTPLVDKGGGINANVSFYGLSYPEIILSLEISIKFCFAVPGGLIVKEPIDISTILRDIEYEKERIQELKELQKEKHRKKA